MLFGLSHGVMPGHLRSPEVRAREMERGPADARPEVAK